MVKGKPVILGVGIIVGFLFLGWFLLPRIGFEIEFLSSPYGYILILLTGLLIAVSGFLPYTWGKILREVALFCLFILLLLIEMNIVKPFVKATKIDMEVCKNYFIPSTSGKIIEDALKYTSCVLTGYFPKEEGDIGWTVFYLFYIILPFAFIWALLYGLMKSLMSGWFNVGFNINALLSFIVAMYAARTLMGGFLLEFAGYGAWGLGALFLAVFLTKSIGHIMDNWYQVEKMAETTRKAIQAELEREKIFALKGLSLLDKVKRLGSDPNTLDVAKETLAALRSDPLYLSLDPKEQAIINEMINNALGAKTPIGFLEYVDKLKKYWEEIGRAKSRVGTPFYVG